MSPPSPCDYNATNKIPEQPLRMVILPLLYIFGGPYIKRNAREYHRLTRVVNGIMSHPWDLTPCCVVCLRCA